MATNSKLIRVHVDLAREVENGARKNKMKITEYSRELARLMKNNRKKRTRIVRDIEW